MLAISLMLTSGLSGLLAHNVMSSYCYPYLSYDLSIILGMFVHHIIMSCFTLIGGLAHLMMYIMSVSSMSFVTLMSHSDIMMGHLIWVSMFLGVHSFGIYIHNDCLLALNSPQDTFGDYSIYLKPYLCLFLLSLNLSDNLLMLNSISCKVMKPYTSYGLMFSTSEFMVHHMHAFILHVLVLIWLKGLMYSSESKTIPDKCLLGFSFPCDGPGSGGTCQVSSWDHMFLSMFWGYNSLSVVMFHFIWEYQSSVWGYFYMFNLYLMSHFKSSDFVFSSMFMNGWLKDFLWSDSSYVMQFYSTLIGCYNIMFLLSHFIWVLSLMFLFSGSGYWQELMECLVWSYLKLKVMFSMQPSALSITQGSAVGLVHFMLGGVSYSWSFILASSIALCKL